MISELIYNRIAVIWITILGCILGIFLYFNMPVELLPQSKATSLLFITKNIGQDHLLLANRYEKTLNEVLLKFSLGTDLQISANKESIKGIFSSKNIDDENIMTVQKEIKTALSEANLSTFFQLLALDAKNIPIMTLVVEKKSQSMLNDSELNNLVESEVIKPLRQIPNILDVVDTTEKNIEKNISPVIAKQKELMKNSIQLLKSLVESIKPRNSLINSEYQISVRQTDATKFDKTPIYFNQKKTLDEVFVISESEQINSQISLRNGMPAISLSIYKTSFGNEVAGSKLVRQKIAELGKNNKDISIEIVYDSADYVNAAESNVIGNLRDGIILTCVCILFFLRNIISTFIVSLSIPISLLLTLPILYFAGISRNVMSLAGITLGVGVVVDATISIINGINEEIENGLSPMSASIRAAEENVLPIAAAVLTTFAVFVPILLLDGTVGDLFYDLSFTVVAAQAISFVCAIFIIPGITGLILEKTRNEKTKKKSRNFSTSELSSKNLLLRMLDKLLTSHLACWTLSLSFLAAVACGISMIPPAEFLPRAQNGDYRITVETGYDFAPSKRLEFAKKIDSILKAEGLTNRIVTTTSQNITSDFHSDSKSFDQNSILKKISRAISPYQAHINAQNPLDSESTKGNDLDFYVPFKIENRQKIKDSISKIPGITFQKWSSDAKSMGLTLTKPTDSLAENFIPESLYSAYWTTHLNPTVLGTDLHAYNHPPYKSYQILYDETKSDIFVHPTTGVPSTNNVAQFANYTGLEDEEIHIIDGNRVERIQLALTGKTASEISSQIEKIFQEFKISLIWDQAVTEKETSTKKLETCIAWSILLTILVLYIQNKSLLITTIIMFTFIWGAIGSFPGLVFHKETLNASALVGFILLAGTIVNNGILLMDIIEKNRREQKSPKICCLIAAQQRTGPVLVTALTTALGMLPMVFETGAGSQMYRALSIVVVYGTLVSTPVSLVGIPCLVMIFGDIRETFERQSLRTKIAFSKLKLQTPFRNLKV